MRSTRSHGRTGPLRVGRLHPVVLVLAGALDGGVTHAAAGPSASNADRLEDIVVTAQRERVPDALDVRPAELAFTPGALGDPLAGAFSLPGVVYAGGDTGLPAVRGSGPNDNLYLVDGLPVPYVFHTLELGTSVLTDQTVADFVLAPAAFGPQYPNVTGAVFDITLREPRRQALSTTLDVSMLRSGVFVESAVGSRGAAYLSYRASTLHLFVPTDEETDGVRLDRPPRDRDYQAKFTWTLGPRSTLSLSANGATDAAAASFSTASQLAARQPDFGGTARIEQRYDRGAVAWEFDDATTRLAVRAGRSDQREQLRYGRGYFNDATLERDVVRASAVRRLAPRHTLSLDAQWQRDARRVAYREILFVCNEFDPTCVDERRGLVAGTRRLDDVQRSAGASYAWRIAAPLTLDVGVAYRASSFTGESFVEPRGSVSWQSGPRTTWQLRAGRYSQFPDATAVLPGLGNPRLRSPRATHVAVAWQYRSEGGWAASIEPYYKAITRLPLALDARYPDASLLYSNDVRGRAWGIDALLRAPADRRLGGWASLSLSRSDRTDQRTNVTSRYYLDTPVIANAVVTYRFRPRLTFGARLTVRSGQPDTPIVAAANNPEFPGQALAVYGEPFSTRLPTYVRLDLRAQWDFSLRGRPSWVALDLINASASPNVTGRSLDYVKTRPGGPITLEEDTGLGPFPAISFRTTF